MRLKSERLKMSQHFNHQWVVAQHFPWLIAGDAHEELVSGRLESVAQRQFEKRAWRQGCYLRKWALIVKVPIPDVLGIGVVFE